MCTRRLVVALCELVNSSMRIGLGACMTGFVTIGVPCMLVDSHGSREIPGGGLVC